MVVARRKMLNKKTGAKPGKERILDAAERLFARHGFYGVSVRDITEAAGVDVALVSYHFGGKRELFAAGREAASQVQAEKRAGHYEQALERIAGLRKAVDRFFEEVMVMSDNEAVRKNRLALLSELLREFTTVADFSEIGADERR